MAEHDLPRDYLVDKVAKLIGTMGKEYFNLDDKFHKARKELNQYKKKYGDIR